MEETIITERSADVDGFAKSTAYYLKRLLKELSAVDGEGIKLKAEIPVAMYFGEEADFVVVKRLQKKASRREYPNAEDCVYGTLDVIGEINDEVFVADWKTGCLEYIKRPEESMQMKFAAVAAWHLYNKPDYVRVAVYAVDADHIYTTTWTAADLIHYLVEIRTVLLTSDYMPVLGDWCRFCPAYLACDTVKRYLAAIAGSIDLPSDKPKSEDEAIALGTGVVLVEQWLDIAKAALERFCEETGEPVPTPYGAWHIGTTRQRHILTDKARPILDAAGIRPKVSYTLTGLSKDLVTALEEAGAIDYKETHGLRLKRR